MDARITEVSERVLGSALVADAGAGATVLVVADVVDFDAVGSVQVDAEVVAYTAVDEDAATITLAAPTAAAHVTDAAVVCYPAATERLATLIGAADSDDDEAMIARVPHALYDRLPVGVRPVDQGEAVQADFSLDDLLIHDITGEVPIVDGSFIDPDTLPATPPPPTTDGSPPASSPAPIVTPGIGELFVAWTGSSNPDPTSYQLHASLVSGFTPGPATVATVTTATQAVLKTMPDGSPLVYGLTYYVRIVAFDDDGPGPPGATASGAPVQVTGPDIAAGAVTADKIVVDELLAAQISSLLLVAGTIETADAGQRVVIDASGIHLYAADDTELVSIPTDEKKDPTFKGNITTGGLTVTDSMLIQGPSNQMDKGAALTLISQVASPMATPAIAFEYDTTPVPFSGAAYGIDYDPAGVLAGGGTGPTYLLAVDTFGGSWGVREFDPAAGVVSRTASITGIQTGSHKVRGIARVGAYVVVGYQRMSDGSYRCLVLNQSDLSPVAFFAVAGTDFPYSCCSGTDGTYWLVAQWNAGTAGSQKRVTRYTIDASGPHLVDSAVLSGGVGYATSTPQQPWSVTGRGGSNYCIVHTRNSTDRGGAQLLLATYELFDQTTKARLATPGAVWSPNAVVSATSVQQCGPGGVTYAPGGYRGMSVSTLIHFTGMTWPGDGVNTFNLAYTWYAATGGYESKSSPIGVVRLDGASTAIGQGGSSSDVAQWGRIRVGTTPLPPDASTARIYALRQTALAVNTTLRRQTITLTSGSTTYYVRAYDGAGAVYVDVNSFPGTGTSTISAQAVTGGPRPWLLGGDVEFVLPRFTLAQRFPSPPTAQLQWNDDRGYLEQWNGATYVSTHERTEQAIDDALSALGGLVDAAAYPIAETLVDRVGAVATNWVSGRLVGGCFIVRRECTATHLGTFVTATATSVSSGWNGCSLWRVAPNGDWTWLADTGATKPAVWNTTGLTTTRLRDVADAANANIPLYPGNVYVVTGCATVVTGTLTVAGVVAIGNVLNNVLAGTNYPRCGGMNSIATRRTTTIPAASVAPFAATPWLGVYGHQAIP